MTRRHRVHPVAAAGHIQDPAARRPRATPLVPLPVVVGAVLIGAVVVLVTAMMMRPKPNEPRRAAAAVDSASSTSPDPAALDVRWRSGRMAGNDCVGTFEVTRGSGTRAGFVAFVMDSAGAVVARDSARVDLAVAGLLVDFRFRHVDCSEIADWQLQATTPKVPTAGPSPNQ